MWVKWTPFWDWWARPQMKVDLKVSPRKITTAHIKELRRQFPKPITWCLGTARYLDYKLTKSDSSRITATHLPKLIFPKTWAKFNRGLQLIFLAGLPNCFRATAGQVEMDLAISLSTHSQSMGKNELASETLEMGCQVVSLSHKLTEPDVIVPLINCQGWKATTNS